MPIYTDEHAAQLAARTGEKWRPANGFEGELFMARLCHRCAVGCEACGFVDRMYFHQKSDPQYPDEIQIGEDGQPTCTGFEQTEF